MLESSELVAALESLSSRSIRELRKSCSTDDYFHLGIATAKVRKLARRFARQLSDLPWEMRIARYVDLLDHGSNEAAHLAVFLLGLTISDARSFDRPNLETVIDRFRGWSVTDAFCIEVLQPLLRAFPDAMLRMIDAWADASNRWKRRASVVIFTRKIGASGEYTAPGLAACERLVNDSDDLVRKGVGWALKDLMRGDREPVLAYVRELRRRGVSSVITLYALKDIVGDERKQILSISP